MTTCTHLSIGTYIYIADTYQTTYGCSFHPLPTTARVEVLVQVHVYTRKHIVAVAVEHMYKLHVAIYSHISSCKGPIYHFSLISSYIPSTVHDIYTPHPPPPTSHSPALHLEQDSHVKHRITLHHSILTHHHSLPCRPATGCHSTRYAPPHVHQPTPRPPPAHPWTQA